VTGAGLPFPTTEGETGHCLTGERPIANAGADQEVHSGDVVDLDGTASTDPESGALTYEWVQVQGFSVPLTDTTAATAHFVAPNVTAPRTTRFRLIVRDPDGRVSLPDEAVVVIRPDEVPPDAGVPDAGIPDAMPADPDADVQDPDASDDEPDAGENPGEGDGGGCGCSTGTGSPAGGGVLAGLVGLALLRRRRRRA
jgi:MYXO-CTERM domain-containing protein